MITYKEKDMDVPPWMYLVLYFWYNKIYTQLKYIHKLNQKEKSSNSLLQPSCWRLSGFVPKLLP